MRMKDKQALIDSGQLPRFDIRRIDVLIKKKKKMVFSAGCDTLMRRQFQGNMTFGEYEELKDAVEALRLVDKRDLAGINKHISEKAINKKHKVWF